MIRTWLLVLVLIAAARGSLPSAHAADGKARRDEPAVDHPLGLVAFANIDRVNTRLTTLVAAMVQEEPPEKVLARIKGEDDDVGSIRKILNSPGLDTTRPIGVMCFPHWFEGSMPQQSIQVSDFDFSDVGDDLLNQLLEGLIGVFSANATSVLCLPYKDRDVLLEAARNGLEATSGESLREAPDQPGWYQLGDAEGEIRVGFAHRYLLVVMDTSGQKRFDLNYPDFASLARGSLGKNDVVYALCRKGLPAEVRDVMAPAFQKTFAAQFQRQDNEPELDFRLRTMSSSLQMQWLDLAISHVDEFRIGGRLDPTTRATHVELEVVGTKGGKLTTFFNDGKRLSSQFSNQPTDDAVFAASMSLPLPAKEWKPPADALYACAQTLGKRPGADVVRAFARTIESGQLDFCAYNPSWNQGLIALRLNGGAEFPDQFHRAFGEIFELAHFEVAVDTIEGVPIHRKATTLEPSPAASILMMPFVVLFGGEFSLPEPNTGVGYEVTEEIVDGQKQVVSKVARTKKGPAENCLWLAATPHAVWLGFGPVQSECPQWFKNQIAASLTAPASARNKSPFQMAFRGLGTTPEAEIQQVANRDSVIDERDKPVPQGSFMVSPPLSPQVMERRAEQEKAREGVLRNFPNAIHVDLRPTETGGKLSITIEEAYFQWVAAMLRDSMEIEALRKKHPPGNSKPKPTP